jgi:hypothetical protein
MAKKKSATQGTYQAKRPTTPAEMRAFVLDAVDWALTAPFLSRFLSQDAKDGLHAQTGYWQDAPDAELQKLLERMPRRP